MEGSTEGPLHARARLVAVSNPATRRKQPCSSRFARTLGSGAGGGAGATAHAQLTRQLLLRSHPRDSTGIVRVTHHQTPHAWKRHDTQPTQQDNIKINDVHEYTFTVPDQAESDNPFGLLLTAKSVGGLVEL